MKEIFRQYGKALIAGILLLLLLEAVGFSAESLRSALEKTGAEKEYAAPEEGAYASYWKEGGLTVTLKQDCLISNRKTMLSELISAVDSGGKEAVLKTCGIYRVNENGLPETGSLDLLKQKGSSWYAGTNSGSESFLCLPTGCYRIRLKAAAENGRRHLIEIMVLVRPESSL